IPEYDLILTYGGGEPVSRAYGDLGARACISVYNALDATTHFPVSPDPRFEASLSFLGNRLPDREERVWEFFFKPAQLLRQHGFTLGGSGWENGIPELPNLVRFGHVYSKDHNAFYCSSRAVLNVTRQSMVEFGYSPATRVFEVAGAGACLISDAWEGIENFLEPGRECLVARNGKEVAEILYSLEPEHACEIGQRALNRVLSEHTYTHRARQVEEILLSLFDRKEYP
ncbi:MAG TPA: glycosyltransferase, partial [Acidobacteriota bacterium]|nr:glycosyltransferase [Acidobacteriota bacterium]